MQEYTKEQKEKIKSEMEISELKEHELPGLADLIESMHTDPPHVFWLRSHTKEYYHWMYFKNPVGPAIVYIAKHNGKIIGSFAIAPKYMKIGNQNIIVGKTMEIFTHPDYQRLGLMSTLAKKVFQSAMEHGIKMWYMTPSKNSYPIFLNKWKYKEIFEIAYRIKILNISEVFFSKFKNNFLINILRKLFNIWRWMIYRLYLSIKSISIVKLDKFSEDQLDLLDAFNSHLRVGIIRSLTYLNWRFVENPDEYIILKINKKNTLLGVIVLKYTIRRKLIFGEIVDCIYNPTIKYVQERILKTGLSYLKYNNCSIGESWIIDNSPSENPFKKAGLYLKKKKKLKFLLSPDALIQEFYNKNSWYLCQGDGNDI